MAAEFERLVTQLRESGWSAGANFTQNHARSLYGQGLIPESLQSGQVYISQEQDFGRKVNDYRLRKKISQRLLGRKVGVDHSAISRIEQGGKMPKISTVVKIIKGLELSSEQIFDVLNSFEE